MSYYGFCPGFATGLAIEILRCAKHFTSMMHTRTMRTIPRDTKYLSQQFSKTIDHRRPLSWSNSWNMSFRMRCSEKSISDHQIANVHLHRITEYLYHAIVSCISRSRIKCTKVWTLKQVPTSCTHLFSVLSQNMYEYHGDICTTPHLNTPPKPMPFGMQLTVTSLRWCSLWPCTLGPWCSCASSKLRYSEASYINRPDCHPCRLCPPPVLSS